MEQLYLMAEIENFYPLTPFLRSGLENWLIKHPSRNSLDILEWAPRDSKVIMKIVYFDNFLASHAYRYEKHYTNKH